MLSQLVRAIGISLIAASATHAQLVLVNGQGYTSGLAVVDAPQASSQFNVPGNLPIAVDVSGNGRLPPSAYAAGSTDETAYRTLELYLVSASTGKNVSVSGVGTSFLTGEIGSTVKHLSWDIPTCVASGAWNLTMYESSRINQTDYFIITPLPITIINNAGSVPSCADNITHPLQPQPQDDHALPANPWGVAGSTVGFPKTSDADARFSKRTWGLSVATSALIAVGSML